MIPDKTKRRNLLDEWGEELDPARLRVREQRLVADHNGSVDIIPAAVSRGLLGFLLDAIEADINSGEIDGDTHTMFMYAYQLEKAVGDEWSGYFDE